MVKKLGDGEIFGLNGVQEGLGRACNCWGSGRIQHQHCEGGVREMPMRGREAIQQGM